MIAIFAAMKAFALFMTIIIFLTGFDFCKDEDVMALSCKEKVQLVKSGKERAEQSEVCSPFCQCARCPFSIVLPQTQHFILIDQPLETNFTIPVSGIPTPISPSVWQPPKFA
jgi:hypothetical protein